MRFVPLRTYTYTSMLDCCILVLKSFKITDGSWSLRVKWFNRRGLDLGIEERIRIKSRDVERWGVWQIG